MVGDWVRNCESTFQNILNYLQKDIQKIILFKLYEYEYFPSKSMFKNLNVCVQRMSPASSLAPNTKKSGVSSIFGATVISKKPYNFFVESRLYILL